MSEPRQYTKEETRENLLRHIAGLIEYWAKSDGVTTLDGYKKYDDYDKIEGAVFSVLSTLDGCSLDVPGFIIAPFGTQEDMEYHKEECDSNWYAINDPDDVLCDIGGGLHEQLHHYTKKSRK